MVAKDRDDRQQSMVEVEEELDRCLREMMEGGTALGLRGNELAMYIGMTADAPPAIPKKVRKKEPAEPAPKTAAKSTLRQPLASGPLLESMQAILNGLNLATASTIIGKQVRAVSENGEDISGVVDRLSVELDVKNDANRVLRLHIGDSRIELQDIREVMS
jgi:hypothetical protein